MRVVIIGGVAAGMSAATRLRRLDESAEIIVLERGQHVSYANCGLPYFISDVISDRDALLLQTPESLHERFRLDVRVRHEVTAINPTSKTVVVRNLESGEVGNLAYDNLVIATGAKPRLLGIPGEERVLALRDVADADRAKAAIQNSGQSSVAIIGGGFIGVELAENLAHMGLPVTLIQRGANLLSIFDPEMISPFQENMRRAGVRLILNGRPRSIETDAVLLDDDTRVEADLVFSAVGVRPESELAKKAGLALAEHGGIKVDDQLRTSDPSIFAAGDAAEKPDLITGDEGLVPLANLANHHGRIVADVIAGLDAHNSRSLGTAIVGAFGMVAAITGQSERSARAAGIDVSVVHLHPASHAGYYPGAERVSLKVIFERESGLLVGAQAVGSDGVDKRIDVLATAIKAGMSVDDLMDLELAYAPQFGSAKDAVNQAGYVGNNVFHGVTKTVQWHEVEALQAAGIEIIDVRTSQEFQSGHIPGAINIDVNSLRERLSDVRTKTPVVYCAVGQRGHIATRILKMHGFEPSNLDGGYTTWSAGSLSRLA